MDIYTYLFSSWVAESWWDICVALIYAVKQFTRVAKPIYSPIGKIWECQFYLLPANPALSVF